MHHFEPNELTALLQAAYIRNRLHHMLLLACVSHGMRVSDALGLTSSDVQGASILVNKSRLKRNAPQLQPLHISDNPLFDERALAVHAGQTSKNARLFPMCRQRADELIRRYGKEAGIPTVKCHMHTLRHTCGHLVFNTSHSLSQVQQILGHRSVNTTLIYLQEAERSKGLISLQRGLEVIADCHVTQVSQHLSLSK